MKSRWYSSQVYVGDQLGRTIDFPTINLRADVLPPTTSQGVYAAEVRYGGILFQGALFYGERKVLDENTLVLEIFLLDFDQEIYGKYVEFRLVEYVRPVLDFSSFVEMKSQLKRDVVAVKTVFE